MSAAPVPPPGRINIHATCIAIGGTGVLLRGPSGSGKSDLALRLIDGGAELVADDRVLLDGGAELIGRPPAEIAGRLEVRGLGIVSVAHRPFAAIGLVVDLVAAAAIDRLPEPATVRLLDRDVPLIRVAPEHASAAAKVRLAVRTLRGDSMATR